MSSRIVKPFFGLKHLSEANSLPDATGQIVTHEITYFSFNPQWKVCALLFFTLIHSVAVSKCRKHWKWSWLYQRNTANLHEEKGGEKINISSRILYTNFSLSANQTDWSLKCLTLNVLLKPLGESKGDELHKGYILAWWKVSCWGMRLEAL